MLKSNILASLFLLLATVLSVTARPDLRSRDITKREPTPTEPTAEHESWTNGQLLAAGLKPRKPQSLYNPSRVWARQRTQPSGTPEKKCYIKVVRQGPGNWDKYVSKDHVVHKDYYGVDEPVWKRMTVSFNPLSSGPFDLHITSGGNAFPEFGFAGETLGSSNIFYATDTAHTNPGSTPQAVGNSRAPGVPKSESAIWFYDSSSGAFTAQWVEPSGLVVTPRFWFIPNQGAIVMTKNPLNAGWEVKLYCQTYRS